MKTKKVYHLKGWLQKVISAICLLSFFLLATIDYDKSDLSNVWYVLIAFVTTGEILIKYGKFE